MEEITATANRLGTLAEELKNRLLESGGAMQLGTLSEQAKAIPN